MTIFLGLDIASKCGYALLPMRNHQLTKCGSFQCPAGSHEQKAAALAGFLIGLIKSEGVPDFAVIEQPQRNVQQYRKSGTRMMPDLQGGLTVNAGTALQLNQLTGAAVAVLTGFDIPWVTVSVSTWRASFFPKGTKGTDRADWKRLAKEWCERQGIDARNADEAEAVGVAMYGPTCQEFKLRQLEAAR